MTDKIWLDLYKAVDKFTDWGLTQPDIKKNENFKNLLDACNNVHDFKDQELVGLRRTNKDPKEICEAIDAFVHLLVTNSIIRESKEYKKVIEAYTDYYYVDKNE